MCVGCGGGGGGGWCGVGWIEKGTYSSFSRSFTGLYNFLDFLSVFFFPAKRLFLLRELNHMEDVQTLLQRNSFPF